MPRRLPPRGLGQHGPVLLRLPYLALTSMFALIRLVPMSDRDKDA
jgi:hypothetical protein